jgi:hypothetical protein
MYKGYIGASPYLPTWKYDSYGLNSILSWLLKGDPLDYGRLLAITMLVAIGVVCALTRRSETGIFALALLFIWLLLYGGRVTWGQLADLLPLHQGLLFHRFSAGVDLGAILLAGIGGEWIWRQCCRVRRQSAPAFAAGLVVLLMLPAFQERYVYYSTNAQWMQQSTIYTASRP